MKQLYFLLAILVLNFSNLHAQNIPFAVGEPSSFIALIQNGNAPCNIPFSCEYTIDVKNSDWTGISAKEKQQIISNTFFNIDHFSEYTVCKLISENKRLTTYTDNNSGESFLIYFGDTVALKSTFNLQTANPGGREIRTEICNEGRYDYEGFSGYCHRFTGKNVMHAEPCMAADNFPAINTLFNLYYGFEKPRYFPVSFNLTIKGHRITFQLKGFSFENTQAPQMPNMSDFEVCKELNFQEFYLKTPELR